MNSLRKVTLASAAIVALVGASLQAQAGETTEVTAEPVGEFRQVVVDYTDLDLTSPAGQKVLHSRISRAAKQVCGPTHVRDAGGLSEAMSNKQCYRDSLSRALSEVNSAAVATAN